MPNSLTAEGLTTATQAELIATLTAAYKSIYGSTISLASDVPDGQMMNIYVQVVEDILDLIAQVYNSFDPDNAIGVVLDQRVAINGIQRQGGTFSQTNVLVAASTSVNLFGLDDPSQQTFTVSDNQGNQWQLITTVLGTTGGTYLFQAAIPGAVVAAPNSLTIPVTVVLGVTSVNNPGANVNTGINTETDAALRVRRQKSTSLQSQGYLQGLEAALNNINGVTAIVHENDTGSTLNGIPGHSIWVIVNGSPSVPLALPYNSATTYSYGNIVSFSGSNYISVANNNTAHTPPSAGFWNVYNPIAQAIYNYRNAGCGMTGAQSYSITQIDESSFTVYWDNVNFIEPFTKISIGSLNKINPPNIATIQAYITAHLIPALDAELNVNQVAALTQIADPNSLALFPSNYGFCLTDSGSFTYTLTPAALNDQFQIVSANIILLPIVLTYANQPSNTFSFDSNGVITAVSATVVNGGNTLVFSAVGGYNQTYTWSHSGGAVSGTTGTTITYTSGSAGTNTVTVTDSLSNAMTCTITVT